MHINLFFDCDGVILNSNDLKTKAFQHILKPYGDQYLEYFIDYHKSNGGISRYKKLDYFFQFILKKVPENNEIQHLINKFSKYLLNYNYENLVTKDLLSFRESFKESNLFIISGGSQIELNIIFKKIFIDHIFNGGIFGNPRDKIEIINDLSIKNTDLNIFFGDSEYDYKVALKYKMYFIFIHQWTEKKDWRVFCENNNITYFKDVFSTAPYIKKLIYDHKKKINNCNTNL